MAISSRRRFLRLSLAIPPVLIIGRAARGAAQGLGQFAGGPPPCKVDEKATPAAPEGPDFKPRSPERSSLLEAGISGTKLVLTGTVSGLSCGPIKRARVDFWQADARGVYDKTGDRLRGHQFTDGNGNYHLETIVPGADGKRAPHLNVRVQPPGKAPFSTQLFFPDQPQNKSDPQYRPELMLKVTDARGGKTATFNIVLDL